MRLIKYHILKTYMVVEVKFHPFYPWERILGTHWIGSWVSPKTDSWGKSNFSRASRSRFTILTELPGLQLKKHELQKTG
jgi:hypothetical protein